MIVFSKLSNDYSKELMKINGYGILFYCRIVFDYKIYLIN